MYDSVINLNNTKTVAISTHFGRRSVRGNYPYQSMFFHEYHVHINNLHNQDKVFRLQEECTCNFGVLYNIKESNQSCAIDNGRHNYCYRVQFLPVAHSLIEQEN